MTNKPILLAQAGRDALVNYEFVLEAPWKACRLCGAVYQSDLDRQAYAFYQNDEHYMAQFIELAGRRRRERWLKLHNRRRHPNYFAEVRQLESSGLPYTPEAAQCLSTYGIIYMGDVPSKYENEIADALFEAPRAPINDADGS